MNTRFWLLLLAAYPLACLPASAATSTYTLAYYNMAGAPDGERVSTMVASIDAAPGFAAKLSDRKGESWRMIPAGVEPDQWLSLVKVKFGQQCDFLLFRFADRNGTVAYAGRRPSRVREVKYYYSVPPGPDQIPENAIRETATDFVFLQSNETAVSRPLIKIRVEPWAVAAAAEAEPGGASLQPDVLEAMAFAAAYEAGWQPTAGEAPVTLGLSSREEMGIFAAVCGRKPNQELAFFRRNIPREAIYDHLARLFFRLRQPAVILESAAFGPRDAAAVAWKDGRLFLSFADGLKAVQPASGRAVAVSSNDLPATPSRFTVESNRVVTVAGAAGWRYDPGERLLGPPVERDGLALVVGKNNAIALLDAATGAVKASRTWPTWLRGFALVPGKGGPLVAVTDLRKRLTLLRPADLAPVLEVAFPWELRGPVWYGDKVPAAWALSAAEEPEGLVAEMETGSAATRPALLCQDKDGFVHAVIPPAQDVP